MANVLVKLTIHEKVTAVAGVDLARRPRCLSRLRLHRALLAWRLFDLAATLLPPTRHPNRPLPNSPTTGLRRHMACK